MSGHVARGLRPRRYAKEERVAGFFARMGNLWKGFLSLWISDIEKENPEIAYENSINSMM